MRLRMAVVLLACVFLTAVGCDSDDASNEPDAGVVADLGTTADLVGDEDAGLEPDLVSVDTEEDSGGPWRPPQLAATVARYDMNARPAALPYPYDYYFVEDPEMPSGRRVESDEDLYSNNAVFDVFDLVPEYRESVRLLEGFGPFTWASVELSGDVPLDWYQAPDAELPADAPVQMFLWDGGSLGEAVPFDTRMVEVTKRNGEVSVFLDAVPTIPFDDEERYVIVVTREFLDTNSEPIGPDGQFQMVSGLWGPSPDDEIREHLLAERARMQPLFDALDTAGYPRENLAAAWDISVGHPREALFAVADDFATNPDLNQIEYTFDPEDDGTDNIYLPGEPGFPNVENVALWVDGSLTRRDYRDPAYHGGAFHLDDDGHPILQVKDENAVGFYFALPEAALDGPVPIAIVGHGIESNKGSMRRLVGPICGAGFAFIAFDMPKHENGGEGAGIQFLGQIINPLAGRDNFRQAGIDIMTIHYMLQGWIEDGMDLVPAGGDGTVDLLASPMIYWGHSLGSMVGYVGTAIGTEPQANVFAVGGGGLFYFIKNFMKTYNLTQIFPQEIVHGIELLAGPLFAPGDPINYAPRLRPDPRVGDSRQVLLMEVMNDDTMPEGCVEAAARAMELPQVGTLEKPVFGLPQLPAGQASGGGLVQYSDSAHNLTLGSNRTDEAVAQGVHFIKTFFETGTGEILHPFPMDQQ